MSKQQIELKVGHIYAAKRPKACGMFPALYNDRMIKWMDSLGMQVQYDSPSVPMGRHYPRVDAETFLRWAAADITEGYPKDEWREVKSHE